MLFEGMREPITMGWIQSFLARHPNISRPRAEAIDRLRSRTTTSYTIKQFFEVLAQAFDLCRSLSGGVDLTQLIEF